MVILSGWSRPRLALSRSATVERGHFYSTDQCTKRQRWHMLLPKVRGIDCCQRGFFRLLNGSVAKDAVVAGWPCASQVSTITRHMRDYARFITPERPAGILLSNKEIHDALSR